MSHNEDNLDAFSQLREALGNCYKIYKIVFFIALALFLLSGIHWVEIGQVAYVQRFGKWLEKVEGPGSHLAFPFFIDNILHFDVSKTHTTTIGSFSPPSYQDDSMGSSRILLTKDENLIHCEWSITVTLNDPLKKHIFSKTDNIDQDLKTITHFFNSTCIAQTSKLSIEEILANTNQYEKKIFVNLNNKLQKINSGYKLSRVNLVKIGFPEAVKESVEGVQRQLAYNIELINKAEIMAERFEKDLQSAIEKNIEGAHTKAAILKARMKAEANNMSTILKNYPDSMHDTLLKYRLQNVLTNSLKASKDQTFVVQKGSELRINLAEDDAVDKIKRQKEKLHMNEANR